MPSALRLRNDSRRLWRGLSAAALLRPRAKCAGHRRRAAARSGAAPPRPPASPNPGARTGLPAGWSAVALAKAEALAKPGWWSKDRGLFFVQPITTRTAGTLGAGDRAHAQTHAAIFEIGETKSSSQEVVRRTGGGKPETCIRSTSGHRPARAAPRAIDPTSQAGCEKRNP
jgi:hypothetical protein